MHRRRLLGPLTALTATAALLVGGLGTAEASSDQLFVYRVPAATDAATRKLANGGFDVLENRSGTNLFVMGDAATGDRLRRAGFHPTIDQKIRPAEWSAPSTRLVPGAPAAAVAPIDETYYGGFHTLKGQYAPLDKGAAGKPAPANGGGYRGSYLKTRHPAPRHHPKAACNTPKHARGRAPTPP